MKKSLAVILALVAALADGRVATAESPAVPKALHPHADQSTSREPESRQPTPAALPATREQIAALDDFAGEPNIEAVQGWAVHHAHLSPFEASRLLRHARLRGALPTVRLHARYRNFSSTRWDEVSVVDRRDLDNDLSLNLWLEWDLAELAAGTDLARALRESRARLELRHAVVAQVTADYFDRRRLQVEERLAREEQPDIIVRRRLRVQELDATLDGLTGGRWSHALRSDSGERPREDPDSRLRVPVHSVDRASDP